MQSLSAAAYTRSASSPGPALSRVDCVTVTNLCCRTPSGRPLLRGVNLKVLPGGFAHSILLRGASGCGKSTLLRCIAGCAHWDGDVSVGQGQGQGEAAVATAVAAGVSRDTTVSPGATASDSLATFSGIISRPPCTWEFAGSVDGDDRVYPAAQSPPQSAVMFVPQRPYVFEGTLAALLTYPMEPCPAVCSNERLVTLLKAVHMFDPCAAMCSEGIPHEDPSGRVVNSAHADPR
jgi:hypothetical protein